MVARTITPESLEGLLLVEEDDAGIDTEEALALSLEDEIGNEFETEDVEEAEKDWLEEVDEFERELAENEDEDDEDDDEGGGGGWQPLVVQT